MAPGGGADGGRDIGFREGDTAGIAFVTLEKKIKQKFKEDLSKQDDAEGVIALFCNVNVTPSLKLDFTREAIAKGYRLLVFDLERLRSLLDSSLKEIRRCYLQIDDEVAVRLRSEVRKLLRFPEAVPDDSSPPALTERILANKLPRRLFELLMRYEGKDVREIPQIGDELHHHMTGYYHFRQVILRFEQDLMSSISKIVGDNFDSQTLWNIYFRYALFRFYSQSKEGIIAGGNFLNRGVTWDDTEKIFTKLSNEPELTSQIAQIECLFDKMIQRIDNLIATNNAA